MQDTEEAFCAKDKKEQGQGAIYNFILNVLHDLHPSKCKKPHNIPYDAFLWKPAECNNVCKTNNCNLLRELTQLMGTSWFRPTLEDEHMPKYPIPFSSFLTGHIFLIAYLFLMGI